MADSARRIAFNNLAYEQKLWAKGIDLIAGVDEVGRGALAGPMVASAVILKSKDLKQLSTYLSQLNQNTQVITHTNNDISLGTNQESQKIQFYQQMTDSKLLSPKKREELSAFIIKNCVCYSVFQVDNKEIDTHGVSSCTQKAFAEAVKLLTTSPEHILTDAFSIKAFPQAIQTNILSGDKFSITISAASIVAKVFRDKLMCDFGSQPEYAMYDFARHKGYGTKLHIEKISRHGISNLHRHTFIH